MQNHNQATWHRETMKGSQSNEEGTGSFPESYRGNISAQGSEEEYL